jgi:hypothetical protein
MGAPGIFFGFRKPMCEIDSFRKGTEEEIQIGANVAIPFYPCATFAPICISSSAPQSERNPPQGGFPTIRLLCV